MRISGFTMAKNASKLYYPIAQSIQSILPIVDEFIVALGDCDEDDTTRAQIENIKSTKIKIIDTVWDLDKYPRGMENAHQTDIAKSHCTGDWLFYLQADEVVHEDDLSIIKEQCRKYLNDSKVEGMLFDYYHFWGDYQHYHYSHGWYKKEIRIIRNHHEIHSWVSAQSFRKIPNFDGLHYRQKKGTYKLNVIKSHAHIYHYGWVRPPHLMKKKNKALYTIHHGKAAAQAKHAQSPKEFNYGSMKYVRTFKGTHPSVMNEWMQKFNWQDKLSYTQPRENYRRFNHEKWCYRTLSFIENILGFTFGGLNNFKLIR